MFFSTTFNKIKNELKLGVPSTEVANAGQKRARVVVVGAGFGGLNVIRELGNQPGVDVVVIDRNNYHGFWPLLYQVATAGLEPEAIAYPVRAITRRYSNVDFQMAEVRGVDLEKRQVLTDRAPLDYDYLVLSAGSANNYFGNNSLAERTYGLKDVADAVRLRTCVLTAFEQATRENDPDRRKALTTFAIVGAGPTGVELAGAFSELIQKVLSKDYPKLDVNRARVVLIEAMDKVLAPFPTSLQQYTVRRLEKMGVQIRLNTSVSGVEDGAVHFKDGSKLLAGTVIWTAGVKAAGLADRLEVPKAKGNRVSVQPTLNLENHPEVFVIGDMAYLTGFQNKPDQTYPMVAPVAIQMGQQAARNILAALKGESGQPFHYIDKGNLATIGRRAAIMDAFGIKLTGRLAWLAWLVVHLLYLVGFRNRIIVLTNWAYNYFTYDRGARLIWARLNFKPSE